MACEDANGDFYGVGVYNNIFNPEVSPLFSPFEDVESYTAIFQVQSTAHMNILFHCCYRLVFRVRMLAQICLTSVTASGAAWASASPRTECVTGTNIP